MLLQKIERVLGKKDSGHCLPNYGEWRLKPVTENRGLLEPMVVR